MEQITLHKKILIPEDQTKEYKEIITCIYYI